MHPLLASPRRLGLYLLAWVPFAAFLNAIFQGKGIDAEVIPFLAAGMSLLYAFLVLSAYYSCRLAPLPRSSAWQVISVQVPAAVSSTLLWLGLTSVAILMAQHSVGRSGVLMSFVPSMPTLAAVGLLVFTLSVACHYLAFAIEQSRQIERQALQLEVVARDAELKVLRAQIDPHFLFNCLHSIASLTTTDPTAARKMCVLLGDFLRTSLKVGQQRFISLEHELALVRGYLAIEQIRLGARLQVSEQVDPATLRVEVPPLLMHPLVENAVTHGIGHLLEGGRIDVRAELDRTWAPPLGGPSAGRVRLRVSNSCDADRPQGRGVGVGLENVRRRLETIYGHEAALSVRSQPELFAAEILLPASFRDTDLPDSRRDTDHKDSITGHGSHGFNNETQISRIQS
jgi:two-component system, LytTR family, sensor histidine kinase AlgZ